MDRNTLIKVMFILQNPSRRTPIFSGLSASFVDVDPGIARADLLLELLDEHGSLGGWFEYSCDLFEESRIAQMAAHLETLLEAIVANAEERISRLSILPRKERMRVLIDFNNTQKRLGRLGTFSDCFAKHAECAPNAVAVSDSRIQLTYCELAHRSRAITTRLAETGVGPDVVVTLLGERNVDLLAAMIAVQQVGGAFLPLDPSLPSGWLAQIIQSSRTPLLLAGQHRAAVLEKALSEMPDRMRPQVMSIAKLRQTSRRARSPLVRPAPSSLAYVIYTSGSTGTAKGAMVEQRGLLNHLLSRIWRSDCRLQTLSPKLHRRPLIFRFGNSSLP